MHRNAHMKIDSASYGTETHQKRTYDLKGTNRTRILSNVFYKHYNYHDL